MANKREADADADDDIDTDCNCDCNLRLRLQLVTPMCSGAAYPPSSSSTTAATFCAQSIAIVIGLSITYSMAPTGPRIDPVLAALLQLPNALSALSSLASVQSVGTIVTDWVASVAYA
ncbi:hypothetical protein E4U43_006104 [Claviceps pusilla]|uniref:Uncharacterized protein n=1 Tax=Claviceps pusilla TaxID=123648 RepID=A0A9P7NGF8_9HYPO|nr:hypothetical protein E4U43_006104 [Claviceps pusilla]